MKVKRNFIIPALLLVFLFASYTQAQEELVFTERFINMTAANKGFDEGGWSSMQLDPQDVDAEKPVDISALGGHPTASVSGISGTDGYEVCFCDEDPGAVFHWAGSKALWWLDYTDKLTLDRSQMELSKVEIVFFVTHDWNPEIRFAVKIAGQWFATAAVTDRGDAENKEWVTHEYILSTEGSDWMNLTAEVDVALQLGDPVSGSLPAGDIEAIGFYVYKPPQDGAVVFDEVQVYAVPAEGGGNGGNGGGETPQWAGYDIVEQDGKQLVDTGSWMGWVDVTAAPWVYPFSINAYVYLEEAAAADPSGAWVYFVK